MEQEKETIEVAQEEEVNTSEEEMIIASPLDDVKDKFKQFLQKIKNRDFDFPFTKKHFSMIVLIVVMFFIFDQVTKYMIAARMNVGQSYEFIDGFFYFTYVRNEGMAWSLLSGARWLFIIVGVVAVCLLSYFFVMSKKHEILTRYGLVLTVAGALGNLYDRILFGYVRDFINFYIFNYDFPIFNIADICVCVGIGLIMLDIIIQEYQIWKLSKSL